MIIKRSEVTGKEYDADRSIYILNIMQVAAYLNNGGSDCLVDIIYDRTKKKIIYVFEMNDKTRELYKQWNNHDLDF